MKHLVVTYSCLASEALGIGTHEIIALVGGGGKTTLMFQLAGEISLRSMVVTTTTTRIFTPNPDQSPRLVVTHNNPGWRIELCKALNQKHHVTLAHYSFDGGKLKGHEREEMEEILRQIPAPYIIVEADGSRQKPLKASRHDEPLVPDLTTLMVGLVGWDCMGKEVVEENVHRVQMFRETLGLSGNAVPVTEELIAQWIAHPMGLQKNLPNNARFVLFLNKCDDANSQKAGVNMANKIVQSPLSRCRHAVVGSLQNNSYTIIRAA